MKNMLARILACLLVTAMLLPCVATAELTFDFSVPKFEDIFTPASGTEQVHDYRFESSGVETYPCVLMDGELGFEVPTDWYCNEGDTGVPNNTFYTTDGEGMMGIEVVDDGGQDMVPLFEAYKQMYTEMYEQMGATIRTFNLLSYGGRPAMVIELDYLGCGYTAVMVQNDDYTVGVIFTFAGSAQTHVKLVMDSVWMK